VGARRKKSSRHFARSWRISGRGRTSLSSGLPLSLCLSLSLSLPPFLSLSLSLRPSLPRSRSGSLN
jgi:hypothetical protein